MLYFDRIDISEGTDIDKISASKECDICCCWLFYIVLSFNQMSATDVIIY